jgi:hypothetical protein
MDYLLYKIRNSNFFQKRLTVWAGIVIVVTCGMLRPPDLAGEQVTELAK